MTTTSTIVVGVDGSERNHAAVLWARHEAGKKQKRLLLVAATDGMAPLTRFFAAFTNESVEDHTRKMLNRVRDQLGADASASEVTTLVGSGEPADVILGAAAKADMVVVGKRGIGAVKRIIVGSTSITVAGRSRVPVVVVPDQWSQATQSTNPIVVGVDGTSRDEPVLDFAFDRAQDQRVPLIAVYAWQLPAIYSWSSQDVEKWSSEALIELEVRLKPWADRYPGVELVRSHPQANAAMALLDADMVTQLIVLGRHAGPEHLGGFAFGSTTRGVLHYSTCPIAVIPSPPAEATTS